MRAQADRVLGGALVALAAGVVWHAQSLEVAFAADPVGPKAFPTVVALAMGACGILLLLRAGTVWEKAERVLPGLAAAAAMAAYALLLAPLGFITASALLCLVIALAFSATILQAVVTSLVTAPLLWLLLDRVLDLPLPAGPLGF
ncbi:tripartite tricarboxylate transporter TctB family protein [Falsiroseomonas oryzae]|uniref:tripartite tricarboxylate transporter TctB family protein n=1 Tax=Falsiroseomonas oryzae TaxID=2766473 RepID=UPI0022EB6285|nr:tripartite tricarboxylate transporter TctB family protein [Roseomonas sp. MO-31]